MYGFVAFLQRHLKIKQITGEKMGFSDWHYITVAISFAIVS